MQHRQLGHRQIAFVGGPPDDVDRARTLPRVPRGQCAEARPRHRRGMVVNGSPSSEKAGKESLARIFEVGGRDFTAVVAANDLLALGCFDAIVEAGLRCPHDISVHRLQQYAVCPPFQSLAQQQCTFRMMRSGFASAELLLERINQPEVQPRTIRLQPNIVIGDSTRAVWHGGHAREGRSHPKAWRARTHGPVTQARESPHLLRYTTTPQRPQNIPASDAGALVWAAKAMVVTMNSTARCCRSTSLHSGSAARQLNW